MRRSRKANHDGVSPPLRIPDGGGWTGWQKHVRVWSSVWCSIEGQFGTARRYYRPQIPQHPSRQPKAAPALGPRARSLRGRVRKRSGSGAGAEREAERERSRSGAGAEREAERERSGSGAGAERERSALARR
jgi:hypothetical protein